MGPYSEETLEGKAMIMVGVPEVLGKPYVTKEASGSFDLGWPEAIHKPYGTFYEL